MMKKVFSIFSLVLMFVCCNCVFTSCSKDDDDVKKDVDMELLGAWEDIDEYKDCRDVITFYSDGTYQETLYPVISTYEPEETDENGAYGKNKGTYTTSNGVLTIYMTHEFSVSEYGDKDWHEYKKNASVAVNYQVKEDKLIMTHVKDGKEDTATFTKVK